MVTSAGVEDLYVGLHDGFIIAPAFLVQSKVALRLPRPAIRQQIIVSS